MFLLHKKRSAQDAHSREKECVAEATALGARVSQAKLFFREEQGAALFLVIFGNDNSIPSIWSKQLTRLTR